VTIDLAGFVADHVIGFLLVVARLGGLFVLAPVFSAHMLPVRLRALMAAAIALAIMPVALHGQTIPANAGEVTLLLVKETAVGLAFAFPLAVLMAAIQAGAGLVDTIIGFSFAAILDPVNNQQSAVVGQFYSLFAMMVFLLAGGDHIMLQGLAASYRELPVTAWPDTTALAAHATAAFAQVWVIGLEIVAPPVVALVITDAALGLVSRAVPQMNVFVVGLPAKILVGFTVIAAGLPFLSTTLSDALTSSVAAAVRTLGPG
jgi:flagellar biosynthesis protein FliR